MVPEGFTTTEATSPDFFHHETPLGAVVVE